MIQRSSDHHNPLSNQQVAELLEEIAGLLESQNANPFRVRSYREAANTLRQLETPVSRLLDQDGLAGLIRLPRIGRSLARSIEQLTWTGRLDPCLAAQRLGSLRRSGSGLVRCPARSGIRLPDLRLRPAPVGILIGDRNPPHPHEPRRAPHRRLVRPAWVRRGVAKRELVLRVLSTIVQPPGEGGAHECPLPSPGSREGGCSRARR